MIWPQIDTTIPRALKELSLMACRDEAARSAFASGVGPTVDARDMDAADQGDHVVAAASLDNRFSRVRHSLDLRSSLANVNPFACDDRDASVCELREKAQMSDAPFSPDWIKAELRNSKRRQTDLVRFMNDNNYDIDTTKISKSLNNARDFKFRELLLIGSFFGYSDDESKKIILENFPDSMPFPLRMEISQETVSPIMPNAGLPERLTFDREPLPLLGKSLGGGPNSRVLFNGQKLGEVDRPKRLAEVPNAYATFVHGTSMEPRYEAGEIVIVNPEKPLRKGCYVVAQVYENGGDPPYGYVKKFVSYNDELLVLEQLNPPANEENIISFPRNRVVSVHRIVGTLDE